MPKPDHCFGSVCHNELISTNQPFCLGWMDGVVWQSASGERCEVLDQTGQQHSSKNHTSLRSCSKN